MWRPAVSILHSAEQVPGGLPVATSRACHHHMLPLEKTGGITASALPGALFGNSLKAKSASARQVSSSTCCPSQCQLTSPGLPRLAAGSAVCCSLLSPLELSYQFPKFYKRNQHSPTKNLKSLGDGECFPPTPSAQRQLPLGFNRSHCPVGTTTCCRNELLFCVPTQESAAFRCTALLSLLSIALELSLLMHKPADAQIKGAQDRGLALGLKGLAFRSGAKAATAWCRELNCTN